MQISLSDEAKADGRDAVEWYIGEGAFPAVNAFVDELEHTLHLLRQSISRDGHAQYTQHARTAVAGIPVFLVYRIHVPLIRVIAIAHHSRRPGYWAGRR